MKYLTLGSCLKQEDSYMMDFVKYHRYVGVEHFVFFDREFFPLKELMKDEPDVEVIHFPDVRENVHTEAWGQLIGHCKGKTKWLALIDADEAIVPVHTDDIKNILKNYEEFASLQINWAIFGSGKQDKLEPGSVYERFLLRAELQAPINNHTQFICQPDRTLTSKTPDPHHPRLSGNEISVNTNHTRITGPFSIPPVHDTLWCAHYLTKSKEEWDTKYSKGRADVFGAKRGYNEFDVYNEFCNVIEDTKVLELWNKANGKK